MKKTVLFILGAGLIIGLFLFYVQDMKNQNIYEHKILEVQEIIADTAGSQEGKSRQIMDIMIGIYSEKDIKTVDMLEIFEKIIQKSIDNNQYVDIQVLLHFYDLSKAFGELNRFEKLKNDLIEQNLVFSFHDNVLLTKENIEETLKNR